MRRTILFVLVLLLATAPAALARPRGSAAALVTISALEKSARARVGAAPRFALVAPAADAVPVALLADLSEKGEAPNYLRALSSMPKAVGPFAQLVHSVLYDGKLAPEVKMGMGLRVAQIYGSPYVAAHMQRLLLRTERGKSVLAALKAGDDSALPADDALAIRYIDLLTRDVHGVTPAEFERVRARYDDSEIVELTLVTCFFNYFTRFCEGLALPVEPWVLDTPATAERKSEGPAIVPRIGLISDAEMAGTAELTAAAKDTTAKSASLGLGIANSMRAMMRSPEIATGWRGYWAAVREYMKVERTTQLQVSFAVSMANGCRYCTVHQVVGLRRQGVDIGKLVAMKKDDEALTPRELTAVLFARKLTRDPLSTTQADYDALRKEFGEQGAIEIVFQTCAFAFMNRFTDGLNLPSEDEAIHIYREVYGPEAY